LPTERGELTSIARRPPGQHTITPHLPVAGGADAVRFYCDVFEAEEIFRLSGPGGSLGHAELRIGDSTILVADEFPPAGAVGPATVGGASCQFMIYVDDANATVNRAVIAGATLLEPVSEKFYGARSGSVLDPFGHKWGIATQVEDVSPAELQRRASNLFGT
jgi:PhnB protein